MNDEPTGQALKRQKRGFLWWVSAVLAPIGIIGGPLAIADLFEGAIRWRGWIGYAVAWWDEKISTPFGVVISSLFHEWNWPKPAEGFIDYLAIGILLSSGLVRSASIFVWPLFRDEHGFGRNLFEHLENVLYTLLFAVGIPILYALIWPLALFSLCVAAISSLIEQLLGHSETQEKEMYELSTALVQMLWLTLGPFVIFLALWGINRFSG